MKNIALMTQRGGNCATTDEYCSHCGRRRLERGDVGKSYRVGSGPTPNSISELDVIDCLHCMLHADCRIVEKDVAIWCEEALSTEPKDKATQRIANIEAILREGFGLARL